MPCFRKLKCGRLRQVHKGEIQMALEVSGVLRDKLRANGTVKKELNLTQALVTDYATNDQGDTNNVDHDTQAAELAKTQLQYDALINQMNGNFARLRSALVTK